MAAIQSLKTQDDKFNSLGFSKTIVNKEQIVSYSRALGTASEKNPILVLIHGYPQSAYMWRHLIPLLPKTSPIFAPDLPGYGGSASIELNDKLSVGNAVLGALITEVKRTSSAPSTNIPVILVGHDRGARISHRLAVSGYAGIEILGVTIIDIVPTCMQWHHASSASQSAKEVTGYFHWPLLANVSLATRMIAAFGGANWCTEMILRWAGKNESGLAALKADESLAVYGGFFENPEVVRASCEDYKHGATTDLVLQEQDQAAGRKIEIPLLLLYSQDYIGSRFDFGTVWNEWVKENVPITHFGLKDGIGHFGVEEAPKESAKAIGEWLKGLGVGASRL